MTTSPATVHVADGYPWDIAIDTDLPTLPQALEAAARTWPNRPVFHFPDSNFVETWSELNTRVLTVAAGLAKLGVRPGDRVGIMLGNVPSFPAAWLGVLAVGAIAVPMNPKYTARELAFIADDTGMTALFTTADRQHLTEGLPASSTLNPARVIVDGVPAGVAMSLAELTAIEPLTEPYALGMATDLANIQYTSGTTGLPKGCMLSHGYWMLMGRIGAALRADEPPISNILADHPFFYMQNQGYFANALSSGAQLHVTHGLSLSRFIGWLNDYTIDLAWVSDALLSLPETAADSTHPLRLAPVDAIDPNLHAIVEKRFNVTAREWYASTEIGLGTISPWEDESAVGSGSMGYPAPFRETKIVGEGGRELERGQTGELCVRGPHMMTGYWNRAEVNAELFTADGWFRTGDLVRIEPDGQHYFVGRAKDMVRRSGENIAAAEVEQQLEAHPSVAAAAVIPVPDARRGEEIKAIVVLADGGQVTPQELVAWSRERLASYKIPRYVEFRSELPYTPSGKIRKAELKSESTDLRTGAYDLVDGVQR